MDFYPQPLSKKKIAPFGEVISTEGITPISINNNFAQRYNRVMTPDPGDGEVLVSIFSALKRRFPMAVDMMEYHPLGSQAFIPMKETTFLCFVSPPDDSPNLEKTMAFIIPPGVGINLNPGVWHFPLISTEDMNFLVIDRHGDGENLVTVDMADKNILLHY